ncbi:hypothetical protein GWI33_012382, partial [Rhynchophorus ferrugineus]
DFEIIYGTKCPRISVIRYNNFQYQITKNGSFRYFYNYTKEFVEQDVLNLKSYCIEHVQKGNMQGYFLFDCYEAEIKEKYTYTMGFKILSAVFLLLTMIIYVYTGETKNIFGKILISYCVSILFLMITLLVAHVNLNQTLLECKIRGYFITWLTLCSFTWLNIMSVNIWSTFSQPQGTIGHSQKKRDIKKFMLYSIYGWGVPVLIVFIIFVLEFTKCLPEPIHPYVGIFYCMFEKRNYSSFLFYLLPQLIFQFINTVVFFKTIIYCIRVKNEINKLNEVKTKDNHKFAATKEKLGLIIKLATVMGVIYIFEVATGFFNDIEKYGKIAEILEIILYSILSSQ